MFSLVNAFLLKPVQMHDPERIVGRYSHDAKWSFRAFSYPNYADLRASKTVFSSLMAHNLTMVGVSEGDSTRRTFADLISSNYFERSVRPCFAAAPSLPMRSGLAVRFPLLSSATRSGGGMAPIRRSPADNCASTAACLGLRALPPKALRALPRWSAPNSISPLGMYENLNGSDNASPPLSARDNHSLILVGRLKPGVTQSSADAQLLAVSARMEQAFPKENKGQTLIVRPLARLSISTNPENDQMLRTPAVLLFSMATVVLLIASLNVANMMLARGADRREGKSPSVLALGAGRRNILQQLGAESLILALLAASEGSPSHPGASRCW